MLLQRLAFSWVGALGVALLSACGGGGSDGPPPAAPPTAQTAQVDALVIDTSGRFVAGATLASSAGNATTDAGGRARLPVATGGEATVRIDKDGYAEQVKVLDLAAGTTSASLLAMLIERETALEIASIESGGSAAGRHGVKVTFAPGALLDGAGNAVTGTVQLSMTPVDVADELTVGAFPGLFEGVPSGGTRLAIASYGAAELIPRQGGQRLQLAAGKSARIELPMYATRHQNQAAVRAGDLIPLWSLDTATGLWRQEGGGTVVASAASPSGLALRADISHFSWWNADDESQRAAVDLTVTAPGVSVPSGTLALVTGAVIAGTGPSSVATASMGVGTTKDFRVPGTSTIRFEATASFGDQSCRGSVDVTVPIGARSAATAAMTCVTLPTPRIVRPTGPLSTNSAAPVSFQVVVDGPQPDELALSANGISIARFPAQFFYTGFWDTAGFAEGTYQLLATATRDGQSRSGAPVTVIVDRTRPQMNAFAPVLAARVDQGTTFTIDFDETVLAAPFALTDAVKLSVLATGQTTPVEIPIVAALDAAGLRLTVTPSAPLPVGVVSLNWSGLRDAAGNAVGGTIALSWNVEPSAVLGDDLALAFDSSFPIAVDAGGVAHLVRRLPGGDLQALRFDGSTFAPLGPPVNDRTPGGRFAIAIDGTSGAVHVAFEQVQAVGFDLEVVVRRYDASANAWQTLGAPFALGRSSSSAHASLAIDGLGRPVLALIGGGNNFVLQGHRFDGVAWAPLGTIGGLVFNGATLAVDAQHRPVVAYLQGFQGSNSSALRVVRHDGSGWAALGGDIDNAPDATDRVFLPALAIAPDGQPWLAWDGTGGAALKLARFDGAAFAAPLDPALVTYNGIAGIAFVNGEAVVAAGGAADGVLDVRRLRNGAWEPIVQVATPGLGSAVQLVPLAGAVLLATPTSPELVGRVSRLALP